MGGYQPRHKNIFSFVLLLSMMTQLTDIDTQWGSEPVQEDILKRA